MTTPNFSVKTWSEIVEEADPEPEPVPQYVFSNGRKFYREGEVPK